MTGQIRLHLVDWFRGTDAVGQYEAYCKSQWLPRELILSLQWKKLTQLLQHAYTNVVFYRNLFDSLRIKPEDIRSWTDLNRIPVLTKEIIRANTHDLLARNADTFKPHRKSTGGSTGTPLVFYIDKLARSSQWACMYRQWNTGGWRPGDKLIYFGGSSIYPSSHALGRWVYAHLNNWLLFSSFAINDDNMRQWVRKIRSSNVRYMHAYASSAYLLAQFVGANGIPGISFDAVFTSAEPLHERYRETISRVFSCPVFDLYGANDGGGFAFECEQHDGLHCVSERAVIEILGDDGSPAGDGETGEIVSTDLLNFSMPFIRYKVGDLARADARACRCGRGLPLLKNIQGRSHEFLTTPGGEKVHGEFFAHMLRGRDWIIQFQVVQESQTELRLYLRVSTEGPADELRRLQTIIENKFHGMDVHIQTTNNLLRAPSGKFKYVMNNTLDQGRPQ